MSSEVYDCIVIGAGIQGSCTAYQLAKNQQKTLLLEQVGYSMICRLFMIHSNVYTNVRKVPVLSYQDRILI